MATLLKQNRPMLLVRRPGSNSARMENSLTMKLSNSEPVTPNPTPGMSNLMTSRAKEDVVVLKLYANRVFFNPNQRDFLGH